MTQDLPSGFVTFLFTDIEGSTRLFRRLGDRYVELLERHNALLRRAWVDHEGHEVKTEGDAFLVAFASADAAIDAAIDAQRALAGAAWPDEVSVLVRMGLHSGLAAPREGDYIAYAVHQAARVVGAAHGGQVLISSATAAAAASNRSLEPLGRYRLRDFDEPVELFSAPIPGVAPITRPLRAMPAMGHNLPAPTTSFVGREPDLEALSELVQPSRVTTILGPGGVGKTRLAVELGLMLAGRWPDGVWICEYASTAPDASVAAPLGDALGVSIGSQDPFQAITAHLAETAAVIILDNCEHLIDSIADLATRLVRAVPSIGIVATSREPLNIAAEQVWRVRPLPADRDAVDLFVDRAREAVATFDPNEHELAVIRRICARLDGVPLAIELAAARVDGIGLEAIETGLEDRFRFLRTRRRDLDARQRSMEALLDWSHDLLDQQERTVFRRLSVFPAGFTLAAAEVAAVDDMVDVGTAIDAVWALADKSLLGLDPTANATRFTMTETVRTYAARHLDVAGDELPTATRTAAWFLDRYGPWRHLTTGDVSALRLELDNIRSLIDVIATTEPETAQLLTVAIAYARDVAGETREGVAEIDSLVSRLRSPTMGRVILLTTSARLHSRTGDGAAPGLIDEATRLSRDLGPEPEWAAGSIDAMRALVLQSQGELDAAIALARGMVQEPAPLPQRARGYNTLGLLLAAAGDAEGSLEAHRMGLVVEEHIGAPIEIAIAHNNIAEQSLQLGHRREAASHQLESLDLAAQIGSSVLVAFSLIIAARIEAEGGNWDVAVRLHGAADRWLAEAGVVLQATDAETSGEMLEAAAGRMADDYALHYDMGRALDLTDAVMAARTALAAAAG